MLFIYLTRIYTKIELFHRVTCSTKYQLKMTSVTSSEVIEWKYEPCQCQMLISQYVPINSLTSIIYNYACEVHTECDTLNFKMGFSSNVNIQKINDLSFIHMIISYTDETCKTHKYVKCDDIVKSQYLSSKEFRYKIWHDAVNHGKVRKLIGSFVFRYHNKKRILRIVKMAYLILHARETGGHLHMKEN